MTREEAIDMLYGMKADNLNLDDAYTKDKYDALEMAIQALEQESSGDLINKQSVLNACEQSINILEAVDRIMDLPSVEQEPKTEQEDDYFRKIVEVAISQLRADRDRLEDELAKREQEPKIGHWMIVYRKSIYAHLVCDKCLSNAPYDCRTNYCPNCGARMESEG